MVLNKEDYLNTVKTLIGDRTDDEALSIVENLTDTYVGRGSEADAAKIEELTAALADSEARFNANDEAWRQKYRDRFYGGDGETGNPANQTDGEDNTDVEDVAQERAEEITIDDLFED